MKRLARLILVGAIALNLPLLAARSSTAQETKALSSFQCRQVNGYYATMAVNQDGRTAPMIVWATEEFSDSGYTPQRRCTEVTNRLNSVLRSNGSSLRNVYLTVGPVNRHVVLCHVNNTRSGCNRENVLFTLSQSNRRASNPRALLENLFQTRALTSGNPVQESGGQAYVNLEALVDQLF
jgi:hypothetical protein